MRNKMGSEDFQKMMRHSREMLFDGLFHHPFDQEFFMDRKQNNFSLKDFFSLINQIYPKYWQLVVGIILGFISTGASLFVPQLAQRLINNFKHISTNLMAITAIIFIGGLIVGALSGLIFGIFGEDVVAKLRKTLWQKLLHLPVKYWLYNFSC